MKKRIWRHNFYQDVTNKILSRHSNCIVDAVMWPKFGNSSISMREVIITSSLKGFDQRKTAFFEGWWSWFKFSNQGLVLGTTNLKFCTSVAKGLKLKVRKFWGLIPTFVEVTGKKLVGGAFLIPPPLPLPLPPILNRVDNEVH